MEPITCQKDHVWESLYRSLQYSSWWPSDPLVHYVHRVYRDTGGGGFRALDIGCGTGGNLWFLADFGFEVYGIDMSPTALALCDAYLTSRGHANVRLGLADIRSGLKHEVTRVFGGEVTFDLIVDDRTIQHTPFSSHRTLYQDIVEIMTNRSSRFWTRHVGSDCTDFRYGVKTFVDQCTAEDIEGSDTVFTGQGMMCFPRQQDLLEALQEVGMKLELSEQEYLTKTNERGTTLVVHYIVIGGRS